jgi:hypothetical protein
MSAIVNYLELLSAHYECIGTEGLFDSIASANLVEQGTVGEVTGMFGNARGPCDGQFGAGGRGFSGSFGNGTVYDTRSPGGLVDGQFTHLAWVFNENTTTDNEIFSNARSVAANTAKQMIHRNVMNFGSGDFGPAILIFDHTANLYNHVTGAGRPSGVMPIDEWQLHGFSLDIEDVGGPVEARIFYASPSEGVFFLTLDLTGDNVMTGTTHDIWTLGIGAGHSFGGTKGNIDHVDWYNGLAFDEEDFLKFWNGGAGRVFPDQYIIGTEDPHYNYYWKQRLKAS